MPKAILEFNLPDESEEFRTAQMATTYASVLWDIQNYMRTLRKYDDREMVPKEEIINKLTELLSEVEL